MINISTTFFHHIHKPFAISLTNQYSFILHFRNFLILSSKISVASISLFYVSLQMLSSSSFKVTIHKKKRRRKENMKKKKRRRQKEIRKEKEEKRKRRIKKVKRRKNMGKNYLYLSLPINTIPFLPCVCPFYHSTPSLPNSIYPILPSSSTSSGRIIRHQWYLSFYIISNLFTC